MEAAAVIHRPIAWANCLDRTRLSNAAILAVDSAVIARAAYTKALQQGTDVMLAAFSHALAEHTERLSVLELQRHLLAHGC